MATASITSPGSSSCRTLRSLSSTISSASCLSATMKNKYERVFRLGVVVAYLLSRSRKSHKPQPTVELLAGVRRGYPSRVDERPGPALPKCQHGTERACHLEVPISFCRDVNARYKLENWIENIPDSMRSLRLIQSPQPLLAIRPQPTFRAQDMTPFR